MDDEPSRVRESTLEEALPQRVAAKGVPLMSSRGPAVVRFAALAVAAAAGFVACGGTTREAGAGSGTLTGTVGSTTFSVASQLAVVEAESEACTGSSSGSETCSSSGQVVAVLLTNRADVTCATAQSEEATGANIEFANFDVLELAVGVETGTVATGTFAVAGPDAGADAPIAGAQLSTSNATCQSAPTVEATGGSITLTQVSATTVTGTYDVTFGAQGSFSGSFNVDICELPDGGGVPDDGGAPTCK
jgi:hypothetical protein